MENEVIDVRKLYPTYRVLPTADHRFRERLTPWNIEVKCLHGAIYAYGKGLLCAWAGPDKPRVAIELLRVPGTAPLQVGDTEAVVLFDPEDPHADLVLALLQPYHKKRISPGHLNALLGRPQTGPSSILATGFCDF